MARGWAPQGGMARGSFSHQSGGLFHSLSSLMG